MSWDDPATERQVRAVAKFAQMNGIKEPIEEMKMTRAEARDIIYQLSRRRFNVNESSR